MTQENNDTGDYVAPTLAPDDRTPDTNQDYDYPTDADKQPDFPEPDWSHDQPIPVYVVERPEAPQVLDWSSTQINVTANAVEILGARRNRTRVIIKNDGTNAVIIGKDMALNTALNFSLSANEQIEMLHNGSVWARCAAGETATVNVMQEFTVELDSPHA